MATVLSGARHVPQRVFLVAAKTVAKQVTDDEISRGQVYPDLDRIRDVSVKVAAKCMDYIYSATSDDSIASFLPEPEDKEQHVRDRLYSTDYPDLLPEVYCWGDKTNEIEREKETVDPEFE